MPTYKELSIHERINAKHNMEIFYTLPSLKQLREWDTDGMVPYRTRLQRAVDKADARGYYSSQRLYLKTEYQSNLH